MKSDAKGAPIFKIMNPYVVKRLSEEGEIELPARKIDIPKDERWNSKMMGSKILKGLQAGDSIPEISKGMEEVVGNNVTSAIRNTRTMVTAAQNRGKLDSYISLTDQGALIKKVWIATPDGRTRRSHMDIDGEARDVDDFFSNGLKFPGDAHNGKPEEVWNCRCSMDEEIIGFKRADGSISYIGFQEDSESLHDIQMAAEREKRKNAKKRGSKGTAIAKTITKTKAKTVVATDLSKELQKTLYNYTNGDYRYMCEYSQYIVNKDLDISPSMYTSSKAWWEKNILPNISEKERQETTELLNIIQNQPVSNVPLVRLERTSHDVKVGDNISFGLRSASADTNLVDKIIDESMSGFSFDLLGQDNNESWTEFRFESSKGIDVSEISAYKDQAETIVAGTYKVKSIEKVEAVKKGYVTNEIYVSEVATDVITFKSKSGKEMVRYKYDGKEFTDTVEKFHSRVVFDEKYEKGKFGRTIINLEVI